MLYSPAASVFLFLFLMWPSSRRWSGALVVDNTIYCIGGIGGKGGTYEKRLDTVECLELGEEGGKRWRQLANMSTPRYSGGHSRGLT